MISGLVTNSRRVLLQLEIQAGNGNWQTLPAVLDTGFTGHLALPERYVRQLGLVLNRIRRISSATEQSIPTPAGYVRIVWRGHQHMVWVLQAGTQPLLGMALLWNNRITIDAVTDGPVTINPLGG